MVEVVIVDGAVEVVLVVVVVVDVEVVLVVGAGVVVVADSGVVVVVVDAGIVVVIVDAGALTFEIALQAVFVVNVAFPKEVEVAIFMNVVAAVLLLQFNFLSHNQKFLL